MVYDGTTVLCTSGMAFSPKGAIFVELGKPLPKPQTLSQRRLAIDWKIRRPIRIVLSAVRFGGVWCELVWMVVFPHSIMIMVIPLSSAVAGFLQDFPALVVVGVGVDSKWGSFFCFYSTSFSSLAMRVSLLLYRNIQTPTSAMSALALDLGRTIDIHLLSKPW